MFRLRKILWATTLVAACVMSFAATASAQFETRGSFGVGPPYDPLSIAVGDFNKDGEVDIAIALSLSSDKIAVMLGSGDGTFQSPVYYSVGQNPVSVATADFRQDGKLDLAVVNYLSDSLSILLGNGDGTFQPATSIALNSSPGFVAVGDLNNDGVPDLVVADPPYVSVLLGNGDGTFQSPIDNMSFTPEIPIALTVGDFNRDGKVDVAVCGSYGSSNDVGILLGNGNGSLQSAAFYAVGLLPQSIVTADFNGDKKLDLAIGDYLEGDVAVLLGNGDGSFQPLAAYPTSTPTSIAVADLNGDGKPDLAVSNFEFPSGVSVLLGKGDGSFQPAVRYSDGRQGAFVSVGDFNGDHKPDLIVADSLGQVMIAILNTGIVTFIPNTALRYPPTLLGTTSEQTVTVTNNGADTLSISTMSINGQYHLDTTCKKKVAPGASCIIKVFFQPLSKGPKNGTLSISDSASSKPQVIELQGAGTVVSLSPPSLNFPPTKVNSKSAPETVTLTNEADVGLNFSNFQIMGKDPRDFSYTQNCGTIIQPHYSCTFQVTFQPTKVGARSAMLSISDNGGGSPQTVPLSGTGD